MISPTSFTDFGWPANALSAAAQNAAAVSAANDQAATADSFQDILAQAVTPDTTSQSAALNTGNSTLYTLANPTTPRPSAAPPASDSQGNSNTVPPLPASGRAGAKTTQRSSPQRGAASKSEHSNRTTLAKNNAANSMIAAGHTDDQNSSDTAVHQLVAQTGDSAGKGSETAASATQHALPVSATAALGGAKSLTGAAFAIHITPATNQADNAKSTAPSNSAASTPQASGDSNAATDLSSPASATPATTEAPAQTLGQTAAFSNPLATMPVSSWNSETATASSNNATAPQVVTTMSDVSEIADESAAGTPQTVRTVQVQLAGDGDSRVDLRLVEHGGGLSVSVRSSDSTLTKGLQDNLPELSSRLAAEKYDTHTFVPTSSEASGSGSSSSDSSSHSSGQSPQQQNNGRSFSQGGASSDSGNAGGGQHGGSQDGPANWWRQLAALSKLSSAAMTSSLSPSLASSNSGNSD